ncbi:hypothetical protein CONCODRAFT_169133 [Conidiobolus coronatus NRRL 28638]|uniref:F-box domain-containing protein n=1 Tax=Conidiobolus coronatus (strain ATCC 28846 / CBS 209.66 / NRRL 28638) TaxID=796925 RepID=A0A137NSQ6_CONC2|nr:hypothetical protein CONCODRAFT_169133 [Conidiobolus coronatus NRRL 28638]|eukprot:KXN65736.1 hypothetical protein CONCODRAFT_169133 [Conidiobolus coronatus NRRL 28638]
MIINNSKENEIDWNKVFMLNEFKKYFDIKSLVEFSLVSQFNRNKLKSRLFSYSVLIGENYFSYIKSNLVKYHEKLYFNSFDFVESFWDLNRLNIELGEQLANISQISNLMIQLINDSRGIEPFIKSLRVQELGHLLYVLYPVTFVFTKLIQLEIDNCTLPLLAILRIGESLKKLKKLTLDNVLLIGFEKQELSLSLAYFPSTLEELILDFCIIINLNPIPSDIYITQNQLYKECIGPNYLEILISSSLKRLTLSLINPGYIRKLLNLYPNVEEITVTDYNLDQRIIDKFSSIRSLTKLSILTYDRQFPAIISHRDFIFPQFNFITNLVLEFSESMYRTGNEFLYFTNHFPNLTQLSIDLTGVNFEDIDIGKFFLETLPTYKKLEILTLEYMEDIGEYNFNWLKFINFSCLILKFDYINSNKIDFKLFSYNIKEIRKRSSDIKFELKYIEKNPEIFDKWNIRIKGEYIYFDK